eukprot:SAG31_NODE_38391_length_296_cov_1.106599_1_plen_52_part_10
MKKSNECDFRVVASAGHSKVMSSSPQFDRRALSALQECRVCVPFAMDGADCG